MKKCKVCGRETDRIMGYGMCNKHYKQFKKYGYCLDTNPRTRKDPNEIILYDSYAEIVLYNGECEEVARTLIDLDDLDKVKDYKWRLHNKQKYVITDMDSLTLLHRFIMNPPDDMQIDHINGNPLDNRKSNLRICTQQQNLLNKGIKSNNTTGITGVYWDKSRKKWLASIGLNGRSHHLGRFDNLEDAIKVRKQAEIEYFGKYRRDED